MGVTIRLLQSNEIALANNFFNETYKTDRSLENFEWEFIKGPCGPAIYIVAVDDELKKIVGIQCAIPIELMDAEGNTILTAKSEDTLVASTHRGQKIFERMYDLLFAECRTAGIKYIWGFTPAKKAFERIGFEIPFETHQGLLVVNPLKAYRYLSQLNPLNKTIDKIKIGGLACFSFVLAFLNKRTTDQAIHFFKFDPMGSKVEMIKQMMPSVTKYALHMNDSYVRWRILENPFNNGYENYQFTFENKTIADVIVNIRPSRVGYIEQLFFKPDTPMDLRVKVVYRIIELLRNRVDLCRVLYADINEELRLQEQLFTRGGFKSIKRGNYFVWKPLGDATLNPKNLFLTRLFTQGNS